MNSPAGDWRDRVLGALRMRTPRRYFVPWNRIAHVVAALIIFIAMGAFVVWDQYFDPCSVIRSGGYKLPLGGPLPGESMEIQTTRGVCIIHGQPR